jgi:hypothetical protein
VESLQAHERNIAKFLQATECSSIAQVFVLAVLRLLLAEARFLREEVNKRARAVALDETQLLQTVDD